MEIQSRCDHKHQEELPHRRIGSVDTLSGIDHPPGVDLHFRKDAKTLSDFRVSIPDETKVRHLRRNER